MIKAKKQIMPKSTIDLLKEKGYTKTQFTLENLLINTSKSKEQSWQEYIEERQTEEVKPRFKATLEIP